MGCGAIDATKPYEIIKFGAIDATKPYKFIGFGAMDGPKTYELLGFGGPDGFKICGTHPQLAPETNSKAGS
jgi:hypothetical protein